MKFQDKRSKKIVFVFHIVTSKFIEGHLPLGELGARGMAELAFVPIASAITNTIYDAVGDRITQIPAPTVRVLLGLQYLKSEVGGND